MRVLDLIDKNKSEIKYDLFTFNDGEPCVKVYVEEEDRKDGEVIIKCRIRNPNELYNLIIVCDVLKRHGLITKVTCYYLMTQRMDRVMDFTMPYSLQVLLKMLSGYVDQLYAYLPHNDRKLYFNCNENKILLSSYFTDIDIPNEILGNDVFLVYADESACDKFDYDPDFELTTTYAIKKRRVSDGFIESYSIKHEKLIKEHKSDFLVVDDLCDGGMTFNILSDKLRDLGVLDRTDIFVGHMVNPKGLELLKSLYRKVYITNSYDDYKTHDNVVVIDVIS